MDQTITGHGGERGGQKRATRHRFKQKQIRQEEGRGTRHASSTSMASFHISLALTDEAEAQEEAAPSD